MSTEFANMLGYPKARLLVHNWTLLIHPDDQATIREITDAIQRNQVPPLARLRWLKRNGDFATLEMRFFHRRDSSGDQEDAILGEVRQVFVQTTQPHTQVSRR